MGTHMKSLFLRIVLLTMLACALFRTAPVCADIVVLTDGRQYRGEIVEETSGYIVFRHELAGLWTNSKFTRRQIESLHPEEGDQSDLAEAAAESEAETSPSHEPEVSNLPKVAVIPLHGAVGSAGEEPIRNTFDASVLRECLDEAIKMNVEAVILDIKSPGGLVAEMEAICETILNYNSSLRIVAFPREAYSAAAIITLCCKEMVVHPDARIGAAVIIQTSEQGVSAVDAKFASPHHAKQKQYMIRSGRPYELVAAMTIQEAELWWSPTLGFANAPPQETERKEWTQVDGKTTILTMTADEALEWKLAKASAKSINAVIAQLGIIGEIQIVDMQDSVDRYNIGMQRRFDELVRQINVYFGSLVALRDAINDLGDAYENRDRSAAKKHKATISQQVARLQTSGRVIQRIDKSLLARRIKVPDEALDQMQEDGALLGRITSLLKSDTYDGFNESVDRLNTVLKAWQQLLN